MARSFVGKLSSARAARNGVIVALALASAACSSGTSADGGAVIQHLTSEGGAYRVDVATDSGKAPMRGENTIVLTISDASGARAPSTGLALTIVPFMPAMGHGASTTPTIVEEGGGRYVATGVDLFMPGLWELRTSWKTASGGDTDRVDPQFQIE